MLMVFNEKVSLTNDFYHQLVNLGIVHLFVVSGLHLNLIYYGIRKILKKHHKISKIFAILIICFYGYLLNFSYGVLRVLFTILCSLFLQKRKYTSNNDFLINTSCSGMMILIINP